MNESTFFLLNIYEYIQSRKEIQQNIIDYLDSSDVNGNEYSILIQNINNIDLQYKKDNLIEFLNLLVAISNNHHRCHFFLDKIINILIYCKKMIQSLFSEIEIFNIFKSNKKILLFLFKEKILIPNKLIANKLSKEKYKELNYHSFFYPEISKYNSDMINDEHFFENREIGENESFICHLIRNDMIVDFIVYVNKTNYSLNSRIQKSIYETNHFLIDKTPTLIEYSAFFGSNQVFKYLQMNGIELTPSLWMYAIHGNNPYIIHMLEEFHISPKNNDYNQCFVEAIKCHHNNIADYININYINICSCITQNNQKENKNNETHDIEISNDDISDQQEIIYGFNDNKVLLLYFKYYNFAYFDEDEMEKSQKLVIYYLCEYNYPLFLKLLIHLGKVNFNINAKFLFIEIQKCATPFTYNFKKIYRTLLFTAILKENIEIIKILLVFSEIDINGSSSKYIWSYQDTEKNYIYDPYFDWWENKTNNIDKNDKKIEYAKINYPLNYSIKKQNIEIIKLLLSHPNINLNKQSIIKKWNYKQSNYFIFNNYRTIVLEKTIEEDTPLITSIKKNDLNIIKILLLNSNLNINQKSYIKLSKIIDDIYTQSNSKIIEINELEFSALSYSIEKEKVEICKLLLLQQEIDVCCKIYEKYFRMDNKTIEEKSDLLHNLITNENLENIIYTLKFDEKYEIEKEAFHIAVYKGNMQLIQHLLLRPEINVNTNVILKKDDHKKEETSFHIAAINDNFELFKILLSKSNNGINIKSINILDHKVDDYGKSLLHIAVMNNNLDMVKYLLEKKDLDINALTCGETALLISVNNFFCKNDQKLKAETNQKIVKLLISHPEIDVNCNMPLIRALQNGNFEDAKLLLSHSKIEINSHYIEVDKNNTITNRVTALHVAIFRQNLEITKILLSHPNIDFKTSFISKNSYEKTIYETTTLMNAISPGVIFYHSIFDRRMREFLFQNHIFWLDSPKFWLNALPIFNLLLQNSDIDVNGKHISKNENFLIEISPIHQLAKNKQINYMKALLSHPNINVNATTYKKMENGEKMKKTALYIASKRGYYYIVKFLLKHPKIDVNIKSSDYYGPKPKYNFGAKSSLQYLSNSVKRNKYKLAAIHAAVLNNNKEIIRLLLSHPKIDVNEIMYIKDEKGIKTRKTALHIAIENNYLYIIELLLKHKKIDINIKINGITALYLAITKGNLDIVKMLLSKNNIDLNVPIIINDKSMRYQITPLHYAAVLKDKKIIDELFLKGAMFI